MEAAGAFQNLQERFLETTPEIPRLAHEIAAAEAAMHAKAARNVATLMTQSDLTHAPRIPLGTSAATPGPGRPNADVVGRTSQEIEGPVRTVESLRRQKNGRFNQTVDLLQTLLFRGGFSFRSKSLADLSAQEAYLAEVDAEEATTKPLAAIEPLWLTLQSKWFELSALEINLRRLRTQIRFDEKQLAGLRWMQDHFQVEDRLAQERRIEALQSTLQSSRTALLKTESELRTLSTEIATRYLRITGDNVGAYRALAPAIEPTQALLENVLLRNGQRLDPAVVQAFRSSLQDALQIPDSEIPTNVLDTRTFQLIFEQLWKIEGAQKAVLEPEPIRNPQMTPHLEAADQYLSQSDRLAHIAAPAPEQATLLVRLKRQLQLMKLHRIKELRQWTLQVFIKLGFDLPLQTAFQQRTPQSVERSEFLIQQEAELEKVIQAQLDASHLENEAAVTAARVALENAREELRLSAQHIVHWLARIPTPVRYQLPGTKSRVSEKESTVLMWEEPAFQLAMARFDFETATLRFEKAFARLDYYLRGRNALKQRLNQRIELQQEKPTRSPETLQEAVPRKDLALPENPSKPQPKAKKQASWRAPKLMGLGSMFAGIAGAADGSLMGRLVTMPIMVETFVTLALLSALLFMPYAMRHPYKNQRLTWIRNGATLGLLTGIFSPIGFWIGIATASVVAWAGSHLSPKSLTTHQPESVLDDTTHFIDRNHLWRSGMKFFRYTLLAWMLFPIGQISLDVLKGFEKLISSRITTTNATGYERLRWPLTYTPPETGLLVRTPDVGTDGFLNPKNATGKQPYRFLVRWVGPETKPATITDAAFVFQTQAGSGSADDDISRAQERLAIAEAERQAAANAGNQDRMIRAETEANQARIQLDGAHAKTSPRDEPMPDIPIEIDRLLSPDVRNKPVEAGKPLILAYQKSQRALRLKLALTPEQAFALGRATARQPMRLRFTAKGFAQKTITIPASSIQKFRLTGDHVSGNARMTDPAKGGYRQAYYDADVLLPDDTSVDPTTAAFVQDLNSDSPSALPALEFEGLDRWNFQQNTWATHQEPMFGSNDILAHARRSSSAAPVPNTSAPQTVARIETYTNSADLTTLRSTLENLRTELTRLPRTADGQRRRLRLSTQITELEGQLSAAGTRLRHTATRAPMTASAGTPMPPRAIQHAVGNLIIFADDPIARKLNPWTQRHASAPASQGLPAGITPMNPAGLSQALNEIAITTSLQNPDQAGRGPWSVHFPTTNEEVEFAGTSGSVITDPINGLSRAELRRTFSSADASRLMPNPVGDLPVKLHLGDHETAPITAKSDAEVQEDKAPPAPSRWPTTLATLAAAGAGLWALIHLRGKREETKTSTAGPTGSLRQSLYKPNYPDSLEERTVPALDGMDDRSVRKLAQDFGSTYLPFTHLRADGKPMTTAELLVKRFGRAVLSPEDAQRNVNFFYFRQDENKANSRVLHVRWIWGITVFIGLIIFISNSTFELVRKAVFVGNAMIDIIRTPIADRDWGTLIGNLIQNPKAFIDTVGPAFILFLLGAVIIFGGAQMIGQYAPATIRAFRETLHDVTGSWGITGEFAIAGKARHPDSVEIIPDEEIRRFRKDRKGVNDPLRLREKDPSAFLDDVQPFGEMLTQRAAHTLWTISEGYLREKPEELDGGDSFFSEGRRSASEARWWASILQDAAERQGTSRAFITTASPLDSFQQRIQYDESYIENIARTALAMDEGKIRRLLARRVGLPPLPSNPGENNKAYVERQRAARDLLVEERWQRVHGEYLDRARVLWAIEEMQKRTFISFILLDAYCLMDLSLRDTGVEKSDTAFRDIRGDVNDVLAQYHWQLPILLEQAHLTREKYVRENDMFRAIRYLQIGFGFTDPEVLEERGRSKGSAELLRGLLNTDWAQGFDHFLIDPDTQKRMIREVTQNGVPTYESLALEYYLTGIWPERIAAEVARALRARLGYVSEEDVDQKIREIRETLDSNNTRGAVAWSIVRIMMKVAPEQFRLLLTHLSAKRNRTADDIRYLSKLAPVQGVRNGSRVMETTNADLLIAELRGRRLQEDLVDALGPLFGNVDWFGDLAFEIGPRDAALSAELTARSIQGDVRLLALTEPSDGFAEDLGQRMATRISAREARRVRVRTTDQSRHQLKTLARRHPGSILEISPQPPHVWNAVNPHDTDPQATILTGPNLYTRYLARLLLWQTLPQYQRLISHLSADRRTRLEDQLAAIRPLLARMNIGVVDVTHWDPAVLGLVPSEDSAEQNNHILIIRPGARPHFSSTGLNAEPNDLTLSASDRLSRDTVALLNSTLWGFGGAGAQYFVADGGEMFPDIPKTHHIVTNPEGHLLAYRYAHRLNAQIDALDIPVTYHTLTTVTKAARGQGVGRFLATQTLEQYRNNQGSTGIALCKIEADNTPSLANIRARGYRKVGELHTGYISRLWPRRGGPSFRRARPTDADAILSLLGTTYEGHTFTTANSAPFDADDNYYVWEENGRILAVVNAKKTRWMFRKLKSWLPEFLTDAIPHIPGLREMFNLADFHSLIIGNVAYVPGKARKAVRLIEAAMAELHVNGAWGFFDKSGAVYRDLKKANAFGPFGLLNTVQETQVDAFALGFDPQSQELIGKLNEPFAATASTPGTKKPVRRPFFLDYRHAPLWWLAPFAGFLGMIMASAQTAAAATVATVAPAASHALQRVATTTIPYIVQRGDSYWSAAQRFFGSGVDYERLMKLNSSLVDGYTRAGQQASMLRPGDALNLGLEVHIPSAPTIPMHEIALSGWEQFLVRVTDILNAVPLEWIVWAAGIGLASWMLIRLLKWMAPRFRSPWLAAGLSAALLAQSVPARLPRAVVARARTASPPMQVAPQPTPMSPSKTKPVRFPAVPSTLQLTSLDDLSGSSTLNQVNLGDPAPTIAVSHETPKRLLPSIAYINARLTEAKSIHDQLLRESRSDSRLHQALLENQRHQMGRLLAIAKEWRALSAQARAQDSYLSPLNKIIETLERQQIQTSTLLIDAPSSAPAVEDLAVAQLRQEYLALVVQHRDGIPDSNLVFPEKTPAATKGWRRLPKMMLRAGTFIGKPLAKIMQKSGEKTLSKLSGAEPLSAELRLDPRREEIQARIENLIASAKREMALSDRLLVAAKREASNDSTPSLSPEQGDLERRLAKHAAEFRSTQTQGWLKACEILAQAANVRWNKLQTALTQAEDIPGILPNERFENAFDTAGLIKTVTPSSTCIAQRLASIHEQAAERIFPVRGLEGVQSKTQRATLQARLQTAQDGARKEAFAQAEAIAHVETQLSLARHLRYLGLPTNAHEVESSALLIAQQKGILPQDNELFRRSFDIPNFPDPETDDASRRLTKGLKAFQENSAEAAEILPGQADRSLSYEQKWLWLTRLARAESADAEGTDLTRLFPDLRDSLMKALNDEANSRSRLHAAELAAHAAQQTGIPIAWSTSSSTQDIARNEPSATVMTQLKLQLAERRHASETLEGTWRPRETPPVFRDNTQWPPISESVSHHKVPASPWALKTNISAQPPAQISNPPKDQRVLLSTYLDKLGKNGSPTLHPTEPEPETTPELPPNAAPPALQRTVIPEKTTLSAPTNSSLPTQEMLQLLPRDVRLEIERDATKMIARYVTITNGKIHASPKYISDFGPVLKHAWGIEIKDGTLRLFVFSPDSGKTIIRRDVSYSFTNPSATPILQTETLQDDNTSTALRYRWTKPIRTKALKISTLQSSPFAFALALLVNFSGSIDIFSWPVAGVLFSILFLPYSSSGQFPRSTAQPRNHVLRHAA